MWGNKSEWENDVLYDSRASVWGCVFTPSKIVFLFLDTKNFYLRKHDYFWYTIQELLFDWHVLERLCMVMWKERDGARISHIEGRIRTHSAPTICATQYTVIQMIKGKHGMVERRYQSIPFHCYCTNVSQWLIMLRTMRYKAWIQCDRKVHGWVFLCSPSFCKEIEPKAMEGKQRIRKQWEYLPQHNLTRLQWGDNMWMRHCT